MKANAAWYNQAVKATKGKGRNIRSKFDKFTDFFDWEEEIKNIFIGRPEEKTLSRSARQLIIAQRRAEYRRMRKGGK